MNKLLKGAIAGAAGIALLTGGAGTFALWTSTTSVQAGTIKSGTLSLEVSGTPAWKNVSANAPAGDLANIANISTYKIVPGDKIQVTQIVEINATGDNLKARLFIDEKSIGSATPADSALKSALQFDVTATGGANVTEIADTNVFAVSPSTSTSTVTLTATITFPAETTGANNGTVDLSKIAITLTQI